MKRLSVLCALILLVLLSGTLVASCQQQQPPGEEEEEEVVPPPEDGTIEIAITAKFATFEPSTITVAKGQIVKLTITSTDISHTFTIDELGINVAVGSGQTVTKEFIVEEAGTFAFYCAVGNHRSAGMEGTFETTE